MAKPKPQTIVRVARPPSPLPDYIRRAHRHLEKGQFDPVTTTPVNHPQTHFAFRIPTDLLALTLSEVRVKAIKEVLLVYRHKPR